MCASAITASWATSSSSAQRYRDAGADELVFYDITASPEGRIVDRSWIGAYRAAPRHSVLRGRGHSLCRGRRGRAQRRRREDLGEFSGTRRPGPHRSAERAFRRRSAWWSASTVTRSRANTASTSTPAIRIAAARPLAARGTGCGRPRSEAPGEIVLNCMASDGVRSGLRHHAARRDARCVQRAADRLRRRRGA